MNKAPTLWKLEDLPGIRPISKTIPTLTAVEIDGMWMPARPLGYYSMSNRINLAWMVFTGRADALVWPGKQ
jgi:hypothetical protein